LFRGRLEITRVGAPTSPFTPPLLEYVILKPTKLDYYDIYKDKKSKWLAFLVLRWAVYIVDAFFLGFDSRW